MDREVVAEESLPGLQFDVDDRAWRGARDELVNVRRGERVPTLGQEPALVTAADDLPDGGGGVDGRG
jgi:hypothetical protein